MPSTPPPSAFRDARKRGYEARRALMPATISLDGTDYQGTAYIAAERPDLEAGGMRRVQTFVASIPKSRLASRPTKEMAVVINGLGFGIDEIEGDNTWETEWTIRGSRKPGRDTKNV